MAEFDPNEGTVTEVNEYLETADTAERQRVLDAETAGAARKGILEGPYAVSPDDPDAVDPDADSGAPEAPGEALEAAVDQGYLGERYDATPLDAYTLEGVTTSDEAARADASPHSPTADGPPTPYRDGSPESMTDLREQDQVDAPNSQEG